MMRTLLSRSLALTLATVLAVGATACGSDSATVDDVEQEQASESVDVVGNGVDRAFVSQMIPHHESAIEMARIASERAEHEELRELADEIVTSQSSEIETLTELDNQLEAAGVEPGDLRVPDDMAGMGMDSSMLQDADPFDRAFIDMMIGHHQGAIRMARVELEEGSNPEAKELAEAVIEAQAREIEQMNEWRAEWYGAPSPAGDVPAEDEPAP